MQNSGFKKCQMIELHNPGIVIHTSNYSNAIAGFNEFPTEGQMCIFEGSTLASLVGFFGIKVSPVYEDITSRKGKRQIVKRELESQCFPVLQRQRTVIGYEQDGRSVSELWAKVAGPNHLEVCIMWCFSGDGKGEIVPQEMTYNGSFTVWWDTACEGENRQ